MRKLLLSLILSVTCLNTITPLYAEEKIDDTSRTTEVNSTETTTMSAPTKYEVLAQITMKFDSGKIEYNELHVGEKIKEPEIETKEGYEFLGWYDEETGEKWNFEQGVQNHTTLVAKYRKLPTKAVNTRDNSNVVYWSLGVATSFIAIVGIIYIRKEESDAEEKS